MRLELKFFLRDAEITVDYRACIMSFLKFALEKRYPAVYEGLYGSNNIKLFSFSVYLPGAKREGKRYILSGNSFFVKFSSSDKEFLFRLYNALRALAKIEKFVYPLPFGNVMSLGGVGYSNVSEIAADKVIIKFLSPLLVRDHSRENNVDKYLDYQDEGFEEKLSEIVETYLKKRGIEGQKIELKPLKAGRTVAICMKLKFNCSYGVFELSARPDVINELYLAGMGSRRSEGFGLFDIKGKNGSDDGFRMRQVGALTEEIGDNSDGKGDFRVVKAEALTDETLVNSEEIEGV
jgi:CRISPR-associated endoribonuclease Cas6